MAKSCLVSLIFLAIVCQLLQADLVRTFIDREGKLVDEVVVPGIPPHLRQAGPVITPTRSTILLTEAPAFDWCYGCSPTTAAMYAGFFDRGNYTYMYAGPWNFGMIPPDNSHWGPGECPLSATHQGFDGRTYDGHVDLYWVAADNSGDDPWGSSDPTGNYELCTADFMGTSQDWWNNADGWTTFFYNPNNSPLYDYTGEEGSSTRKRDGCHGFRLFLESRGYGVSSNYNQYIAGHGGNPAGFTLAQYRNLIDSGIPVFIHLQDHTMLGVGYDSASSTIFIHNTWDHNTRSMTWGGSYSNQQMIGVSVVLLAASPQPPAPSNLSAFAYSSRRIDLTWTDNAANETGYLVERSIYGISDWGQIASLGANSHSYTDNSVPEHSFCSYRIRAHNASGYSNYCAEAGAQTPYDTPATPYGLTATAINSNQVYLNWIDDSSDETRFQIDRKTGISGSWLELGTVTANVVIYYDDSPNPSTSYYYRVKAWRYDVGSAWSNTVEVTTPALPVAPANLTATALISSVIGLAWTDNSSDETGFRIERKTSASGDWTETGTAGSNVTSLYCAGLSPLTTYYFRVRSYNSNGNSGYSNEASATTTEESTWPAPPWLQALQAGGSYGDAGRDIVLDSQGNRYITGTFNSIAYFGSIPLTSAGGLDIFVAKLDAEGNWLWATRAGSAGNENSYSMAVDAGGNIFIAGEFSGSATFGSVTLNSAGGKDIFAASLDTAGNWLWANRAGGSGDDEAYDIIVGSAGFIYVTGYFRLTADFGSTSLTSSGEKDIFLGVLGALGNWLVALKAGGAGADIGSSLIRDNAGNLILTGYFTGTVNFGVATLTSYGSGDIYLAKFNSSGALVGVLQAGGTGHDYGSDLAVDASGNVYVTGGFSGTATLGGTSMTSAGGYDIYVAKLNNEGFLVGAVRAGGEGQDYAKCLAVDSAGNCFLGCEICSDADFGSNHIEVVGATGISDIVIARLDSGGSWLWARHAGGTGSEYCEGLALDAGGNCHVSGFYSSNPIWFGVLPLSSNNLAEVFVAKLGYAPPDCPDELEASALSASRIDLNWSDNSIDENGFVIERKTGAGGIWSQIGTTAADETVYSDLSPNPGTYYLYRVKAYNVHGDSGYSNEAGVLTHPLAPANVSITHVGDVIHLSWDAVSGADAYLIYRSADPSALDWGAPVSQTSNLYYLDTSSGFKLFYRVTTIVNP